MTLSYGDFEVLDQQHIEQLRVQSAPKPVVGDDNQPILNEARAKVLHTAWSSSVVDRIGSLPAGAG